jgi:hypothetical protein
MLDQPGFEILTPETIAARLDEIGAMDAIAPSASVFEQVEAAGTAVAQELGGSRSAG